MVNPSPVLSIQTPGFLNPFSRQSVELRPLSGYNKQLWVPGHAKDLLDSS